MKGRCQTLIAYSELRITTRCYYAMFYAARFLPKEGGIVYTNVSSIKYIDTNE